MWVESALHPRQSYPVSTASSARVREMYEELGDGYQFHILVQKSEGYKLCLRTAPAQKRSSWKRWRLQHPDPANDGATDRDGETTARASNRVGMHGNSLRRKGSATMGGGFVHPSENLPPVAGTESSRMPYKIGPFFYTI
jgi:hypothetical protein